MTNALWQRLFDIDLWFAGAGHFVILCASFQVPYRLRWKQDLQQLMPFNRKMLWVQSGFTVLTIIAFGTLTLALHRELLQGDRAALGARRLHRGLLECAHSCRCDILFARRLAQGNGVCRGTRSSNPAVFFARGELCRIIRLARVAGGEWLITFDNGRRTITFEGWMTGR